MIESLVSAILIISLFQESERVRFPGLVLGLMASANYTICVKFGLEGFDYCFAAGACDVLVMCIVARFAPITRVADTIMAISGISIFLNFYGWCLYANGLPVASYNLSIMALYLLAILSLLRGDCANDYYGNNNQGVLVRLFRNKRMVSPFVLPKKARL